MTVDKQNEYSSKIGYEDFKATAEQNPDGQDISISKENIPSFSKILITDDGKDESNKVPNYGVALSKYSCAELIIIRILEDIKNLEDVSVQGTNEDKMDNNDMRREVKGEVIDEMEKNKQMQAGRMRK